MVNSDVEIGELVGPPEQIGETARLGVAYRSGALEVDAPIEANDLRYLEPVIGRTASIRTNTGTYDAEVVRVSSVVAPRTRLASLFLRFSGDEPPESLPPPGSFAEVRITGPSYEQVYVLPESAAQGQDTVWVVRDGALARFEPNTLGRTEVGWVVDVFDAAEGVVVGTLPGAVDGLAVSADGRGRQPVAHPGHGHHRRRTRECIGSCREAGALIAYFAGNPVAANLLMLFLIVGGLIAGANLAVQHAPEIDLRTVTVTVESHGASPREVEDDINRRIEESVVGLEGVSRVVATAVRGKGTVRDRDGGVVRRSRRRLRRGAERGGRNRELSRRPAPTGPRCHSTRHGAGGHDAGRRVRRRHRELAARSRRRIVRDTLLALPSVTQVSLAGTRDREIAIALSEEELRRHRSLIHRSHQRAAPGVGQPDQRRASHRGGRGGAAHRLPSGEPATISVTFR